MQPNKARTPNLANVPRRNRANTQGNADHKLTGGAQHMETHKTSKTNNTTKGKSPSAMCVADAGKPPSRNTTNMLKPVAAATAKEGQPTITE